MTSPADVGGVGSELHIAGADYVEGQVVPADIAAAEYGRDGLEGRFPEPYEFLNDYTDPDAPFQGIYSYLAAELDLGRSDGAQAYFDDRYLGFSAQNQHRAVLSSMLEQQQTTHLQPPKKFRPQLDAGINYVRFRLALGLMAPAIRISLERTAEEHTDVRSHRAIVAADLTRQWVNQMFSTAEMANLAPSILDQEIEGYIRQHLTDLYHSSRADHPELPEHYRERAYHLPDTGKESDGYRLFDVQDFSQRLHYLRDGEILSVDELQKAKEENILTAPELKAQEGRHERTTRVDHERVRQQVLGQVFMGLGILRPHSDSDARLVSGNVSAAERFLPNGSLAGRAAAYRVVAALLARLETHQLAVTGQGRKRGRALDEGTKETVVERLQVLAKDYAPPWIPVDALLLTLDDLYIMRYGLPLSKRDFWDD